MGTDKLGLGHTPNSRASSSQSLGTTVQNSLPNDSTTKQFTQTPTEYGHKGNTPLPTGEMDSQYQESRFPLRRPNRIMSQPVPLNSPQGFTGRLAAAVETTEPLQQWNPP
ncbi:MAG: hypothetical protein Q9218_001573, partial [Villophora microphyllina]